jgi:diguanylate cyclase (GGDEF)-like protein
VVCVAWLADSTWYGLVVALCATLVGPLQELLVRPRLHGSPQPALLVAGAAAQLLLYLLILWLLAAVRHRLKRSEAQALRDPLTGIANARFFTATAKAELERSSRYRHQLSLIYLDVDDFKAVNDRCGHSKGNRVLRRVVEVISANLRSTDTPARLGGDEFAILMPETGSRAAGQLARRLMQAFAEVAAGEEQPVTCSLGLATFRQAPASVEELIEAADRLMYEAKTTGKNRLCRAVLPLETRAVAGVNPRG